MATKYFKKIADGGIQLPTSKYYNNMTVKDDLAVGGNATVDGKLDIAGSKLTLGNAAVEGMASTIKVSGYLDTSSFSIGIPSELKKAGDFYVTDTTSATTFFYLIESEGNNKSSIRCNVSKINGELPVITRYKLQEIKSSIPELDNGITILNPVAYSYGCHTTVDVSGDTLNDFISKVSSYTGKDIRLVNIYYDYKGTVVREYYDASTKSWKAIDDLPADESVLCMPTFVSCKSGTVSFDSTNSISFSPFSGINQKGIEFNYNATPDDRHCYVYTPKNNTKTIELSNNLSLLSVWFPCAVAFDNVDELPTPEGSGTNTYAYVKGIDNLCAWIPASNEWQENVGLFTTSDSRILCKTVSAKITYETEKFSTSTITPPVGLEDGNYTLEVTIYTGLPFYNWVKK